MKILIVDDEPLVRTGLISTLEKLKDEFEITEMTEASDGVRAREILEGEPYDLVFTDIMMPRMDGIELLRRLNTLGGRPPAIAVLSCYDDYSYVREAFRNNVLDYILKYDIDITALRGLLKNTEETAGAAERIADLSETLYTIVCRVRFHPPAGREFKGYARSLAVAISGAVEAKTALRTQSAPGG